MSFAGFNSSNSVKGRLQAALYSMRKKNRQRRIDGAGGGATPLPIPTGFDWAPPVSVYRSEEGVYSTNFNANDWKVSASVDIWVSPLGNDTTGTGTQALPYRGIRKALQVAAAGADVGYNIFVVAGRYIYDQTFWNQLCNRDLNIIAVGGRAICDPAFPIASWTSIGSGAYQATRAGVTNVLDYLNPVTWPNGDTSPSVLTSVADAAACQALPGSFNVNGSTVTVHMVDGRSPNATATGDVCVITTNAIGMRHDYGRSLYMEGFDINAPGASGIRARNGTAANAIPQVVLNDCKVAYFSGVLTRAITLDGVTTAIVNNCRVFQSDGDGIGYSQISLGNPSCYAVEIDCHVYGAGKLATHTSIQNGSTNHADGRTVRVNNVYRDTYGPVIGDINTTQNWNLGVDAQDCLLADGTQQDASFSTYGGTAKSWLDGCTTGGAFYDLYADAGCQILYRNMTAPASTGGAGIIGTY